MSKPASPHSPLDQDTDLEVRVSLSLQHPSPHAPDESTDWFGIPLSDVEARRERAAHVDRACQLIRQARRQGAATPAGGRSGLSLSLMRTLLLVGFEPRPCLRAGLRVYRKKFVSEGLNPGQRVNRG